MRTRLLEKERTSEREKRIIMRRRMFNRGQNERKSLLASFSIPQIFEYIYTHLSLIVIPKKKGRESKKKNGNQH